MEKRGHAGMLCTHAFTRTYTHAHTHAHTHKRTYARTHAHTHTLRIHLAGLLLWLHQPSEELCDEGNSLPAFDAANDDDAEAGWEVESCDGLRVCVDFADDDADGGGDCVDIRRWGDCDCDCD